MKAVILAAGEGQRIAKKSRRSVPKPLLKLNDRYLIEYVLLSLKKRGSLILLLSLDSRLIS